MVDFNILVVTGPNDLFSVLFFKHGSHLEDMLTMYALGIIKCIPAHTICIRQNGLK